MLEVGIRLSREDSVSQVLYFRDVTYETEVDRMKSEFLSTAAHELRTPMASIYGFTELLINSPQDPATTEELLHIVYAQSERMAQIINELLDLARIEARRGKDFKLEQFDAQAFLAEVVAGFKPPEGRPGPEDRTRAASQSAGVASTAEAALTRWVRADRSKLTQALLNVLANAYKYSPKGGAVELEVLDAPATEDQPVRIGLRVVDHGIGMSPEQVARVCERFYRADASGSIPGTGLGMSIVKEIVGLHGGEVEIASQMGTGTTVTLWIPGRVEPVGEA